VKKGPDKTASLKRGPAPEMEEHKKNLYYLPGFMLIVVLGSIIYSNSFKCAFQFDDFWIIVNNTKIYDLWDIKAWTGFFSTRPVSVFSFALNYHFSQLNVQYYHLVNLFIHLVNACLVWWLTLLIFSSPAVSNHKLAKHKRTIALLVALLFVSHPLATQVVTYITQRMASLAAMFYLLSVALYLQARINVKGNPARIILFVASFLSGLLAVLSKENAYTLPFAIVLAEFFLVRSGKISINFRNYKLYLIIGGFLTLFILLYANFASNVFRTIPPDLGRLYTITPSNYLLTEFSVIVKYIQLLFLPVHQNLDYDFPLSKSFFEIRTLLSFLFLLLLFISGILLYKKQRIISFGIFWFFLALSVESSFIPLNDFIDEYRTYLPSFGFLLALSCGLFILLREKYKYLLFALFALMIVFFSIRTYQMNIIWKDNLSLWNDVVSKSPGKARPYDNRGYVFDKRGEFENAIADYAKAIEINPNYAIPHFGRGIVYGKLGQFENSVADLTDAIALEPYNANAYSHRGIAEGNLGKWDKALADFCRVIIIDSTVALEYFNRGFAYANLGNKNKAIQDFSRAIAKGYTATRVYAFRGMAYASLLQWDKAIADYNIALQADPGNEVVAEQKEIAEKHLKDTGNPLPNAN